MKPEIIKKLNLIETNIEWGRSFINGIKVYRYRESDVLLSKCNTIGEPSDWVLITRDCFGEYIKLSEQFLLNIPVYEFEMIIHYKA